MIIVLEVVELKSLKCDRCSAEVDKLYHYCNYGELCATCYAMYNYTIPADGSFNPETDKLEVILPEPVDNDYWCPICNPVLRTEDDKLLLHPQTIGDLMKDSKFKEPEKFGEGLGFDYPYTTPSILIICKICGWRQEIYYYEFMQGSYKCPRCGETNSEKYE